MIHPNDIESLSRAHNELLDKGQSATHYFRWFQRNKGHKWVKATLSRTQTKGTKPLVWGGGNSLAIYTFLHDVEYEVKAHFEWNEHRPELAGDRIDGKHFNIAQRMLEKGGRQDIFLGVRDCQGYVEPCQFGESEGAYDDIDELGFGLMFHGFDYPDETGKDELVSRFWYATMCHGELVFPRPEECEIKRFIRKMAPKKFGLDENILFVEKEEALQ